MKTANRRRSSRATVGPAWRTSQLAVVIATFVLLALVFFTGGASRINDVPLVVLRPVAVAVLGIGIALASRQGLLAVRAQLALLGLFALSMAIQLIPLPAGLWFSLPMSALYGETLDVAGVERGWRPLSMVPDYTVNSLLSLLAPAAITVGLARFGERHHKLLHAGLLLAAGMSAALGLAQIAGGPDSPLYFWELRSVGVADGVFANRNHHALFLACGLAFLGSWILSPVYDRDRHTHKRLRTRLLLGGAFAIFLFAAVVATGSRTGLVLALLGAGFSYWQIVRTPASRELRATFPKWVQLTIRWAWILVPVLIGIMLLAGRALTVDRLTGSDLLLDQRVRSLPVMLDMLRYNFPWGSGYGSFDVVYRAFEPDALLQFEYMNHAHNDWLELLIVGGLPTLIVIIAALVWVVRSTMRLGRQRTTGGNEPSLGVAVGRARAASFAILLVGLASVTDYPARTPLIACLLAVMAIWLTRPGVERPVSAARSRHGEPRGDVSASASTT